MGERRAAQGALQLDDTQSEVVIEIMIAHRLGQTSHHLARPSHQDTDVAGRRFLPPFEQVRPMVEAEYLRRAGGDALRQYLAWLRERTEIIVDSEKIQ